MAVVKRMVLGSLAATVALALPGTVVSTAVASDIVEVLPLTDRIVMVHFDDGYVEHHKRGQARSDERVFVSPLDTAATSRPASYQITSADDPAYAQPKQPDDVGRKTKGTDFAWFADKWEHGHAVNTRPDQAKEHWLYLVLPEPMQRGKTYTVITGDLAANGREWKLAFTEASARSEAVHVNILGYVPTAPQKFGYVYHWMGDKGSLDLEDYAGNEFHLIDQAVGQPVYSGTIAFRKAADNPETYHKADSPPDGNFLKADVYECDFSDFTQSGEYVLAVDGVGCSFPFKIDADVYREPFYTVCRGLYHNRSGIELKEPYTHFTRPAPHNPKLTPGFAGKLIYSTVRWPEWGSEGGDPQTLLTNSKGPVDSCGWYQDAGDWDSYYTHLRVAQELLTVYEMVPHNFRDGELNIPESGNKIADILDEAAWLPRFCYRLRHELMEKKYGTGGVGLRVAGDGFGSDEKTLPDGKKVGQGSWEDVDRNWVISGEDPLSTYRYAGAAAQLAYCLGLTYSADPEGVDWGKEAVESYNWANANTRPGDEAKGLKEPRAYAAAGLFRLTADQAFEQQFIADTKDIRPNTLLWDDKRFGPMVYALGGGKSEADAATLQRITSALLATADHVLIEVPSKRALRWGGNWSMPMLIGQQTTPWMLEGAVGYTLAKRSDSPKAEQYLGALYTTCDYFLGTNSLNMTWVTGLGVRHPTQVFHMDGWYNGKATIHPGVIPYSPWRKEKDVAQGPWDHHWGQMTLYPTVDEWPGNERWYNNRCSPMGSEFTVHQNIGPAAAIFGFLCSPADKR